MVSAGSASAARAATTGSWLWRELGDLGRARALARQHRGRLALTVGLHAAATVAGLAGPALLGLLVDEVGAGTTAGHVDRIALAVLAALVAQVVLVRVARLASYTLGERVLAELREEFLDGVLALPLGTVEQAGTGDLLARSTRDVEDVAEVVRFAVPETLIAVVTVTLTVAASTPDHAMASCRSRSTYSTMAATGIRRLAPMWTDSITPACNNS
jgi:ABC-type multidrug transport system fused ATPase/permease subunit